MNHQPVDFTEDDTRIRVGDLVKAEDVWMPSPLFANVEEPPPHGIPQRIGEMHVGDVGIVLESRHLARRILTSRGVLGWMHPAVLTVVRNA